MTIYLPKVKEFETYTQIEFPKGEILALGKHDHMIEGWTASVELDREQGRIAFYDAIITLDALDVPYKVATHKDIDRYAQTLDSQELLVALAKLGAKIDRGYVSPFYGEFDDSRHAALVLSSNERPESDRVMTAFVLALKDNASMPCCEPNYKVSIGELEEIIRKAGVKAHIGLRDVYGYVEPEDLYSLFKTHLEP